MGLLDFFSSNYKFDDFMEKSEEEILNMDSNKIDKKYNFIKDDSALRSTQKKAIFLLKLLKNKLNEEDKKGILNIINNKNDDNTLKSIPPTQKISPLGPGLDLGPDLAPGPVPGPVPGPYLGPGPTNSMGGGSKRKYNKNKTIKRTNRRKHKYHSRKKRNMK
jgi:hypothetical protein